MKLFKNILILFLTSLLFLSCDNDENIPAYILVDNVSLVSTQDQGAATHNITDVWVFVNGQGQGVWELPAKIPTPALDDDAEILFFAGIRADGISSKARIYPFYEHVTKTSPLVAGGSYTFDLTFNYLDFTEFDFIEDFESRNIFSEDNDGDPDTEIVRSQEDVKSGIYCGLVELVDTANIMDALTQFEYEQPPSTAGGVYLEMDYKGNIPIVIGYKTKGQFTFEDSYVVLVEQEEWNKIYIDLSPALYEFPIDTYQIKIGTGLEGSELSEGKILLDNIKLLHF